MKKFEYDKFTGRRLLISELDKKGADGWELVSYIPENLTPDIINDQYIFKRELKTKGRVHDATQ